MSTSQSNFISEELCNTVGLIKQNINIFVVGIGQVTSFTKYRCNVIVEYIQYAFLTVFSVPRMNFVVNLINFEPMKSLLEGM